MSTIGTFIQALLLAGATIYFVPYLVEGVKELLQDLREEEGK
jgi:hypothetical protein